MADTAVRPSAPDLTPVPVLGEGFVRLQGHLGGDLSVVQAAKTSFAQEVLELDADGIGLISFLMRRRHGTPFEHNAFTFHVRCPIFISREWFRHRIGSFNEFSTRYKEVPEGMFHVPPEDMRKQTGKPGRYTFETITDPAITAEIIAEMIEAESDAFHHYQRLLGLGLAKEVSRNVLPLAAWTEFYWTVNARSLMNFLSLRNAPDALREIRYCAVIVEQLFASCMPHTYEAFVTGARLHPDGDDEQLMVKEIAEYLEMVAEGGEYLAEELIRDTVLPHINRRRVAP